MVVMEILKGCHSVGYYSDDGCLGDNGCHSDVVVASRGSSGCDDGCHGDGG